MTLIENISLYNDLRTLKKYGKEESDIKEFNQEHRKYVLMLLEAYNRDRKQFIEDYEYVSDVSRKNIAVYMNGSEIVLAFKGTINVNEHLVDLQLIVNEIPVDFFNRSNNFIQSIIVRYPDKRLLLIGHSLGGVKVLYYSSIDQNVNGIVFNPFIPSVNEFMQRIIESSPSVLKYTIIGDKLSNKLLSFNDNTIIPLHLSSSFYTVQKHGISSFLLL